MRCPVCDSLNREHLLLCQVEASVTLLQRRKAIPGAVLEGTDIPADAEEIVLSTRIQESRIMAKLTQHCGIAHPLFSRIA